MLQPTGSCFNSLYISDSCLDSGPLSTLLPLLVCWFLAPLGFFLFSRLKFCFSETSHGHYRMRFLKADVCQEWFQYLLLNKRKRYKKTLSFALATVYEYSSWGYLNWLNLVLKGARGIKKKKRVKQEMVEFERPVRYYLPGS